MILKLIARPSAIIVKGEMGIQRHQVSNSKDGAAVTGALLEILNIKDLKEHQE